MTKLENRKMIEIPIEYFELQISSEGCNTMPSPNDTIFYRFYHCYHCFFLKLLKLQESDALCKNEHVQFRFVKMNFI